jgi:hypothetical protein
LTGEIEKPSYETWRDREALNVAQKIEDLFCQHHIGGRMQRLAKIQCLLIGAMEAEMNSFTGAIEHARMTMKENR